MIPKRPLPLFFVATLLLALFLGVSLAISAPGDQLSNSPDDPILKGARGTIARALEEAHFALHPPSEEDLTAGIAAWQTVYETLQHPRCMNCHPAGNQPLQTDQSRPHAMNISRESQDGGLACATCHMEQNADLLGIPGGPPGAPHWQLPEPEMPLIFEGRSPNELCEQFKRPQDNGFKTLEALLDHVRHDALVLWGWEPGGDRTTPPHSHDDFAAAFEVWVRSAGACPP